MTYVLAAIAGIWMADGVALLVAPRHVIVRVREVLALAPSLLRWGLLGGWLVVTLVLSVLLKTFVAVGVLPMIAIYFAVNKPRGVLLSDRGLASLRCGFFNGRPTGLLGLAPLTALDLRIEARSGSTKLQIGDDQTWLADKDLARFLDLAPRPGSPPPAAAF